MWKDYSSGYIKHNRSSSISVLMAAFISALLLSVLCGLFYNAWKYDVERIEIETGSWHSKIVGQINREQLQKIENYKNIDKVVVKKQSDMETVAELYFQNKKTVFADTPKIANIIGCPEEMVTYNYELLSMYLIRSSQDTAPRLLFPLFLLILLMAAFSLIAIIHNAFSVSMNARIHQFGILSSIGATPRQIKRCLLQEAAVLCVGPVIIGNALGIAITKAMMIMLNRFLDNPIEGKQEIIFGYHPLVLLLTIGVSLITILISAWLPARKMSKLTPLEAIKNTGELQLKKVKKRSILARLFGMEGELARNALKAQRKSFRTATCSLVVAVLAFTMMQCFFTLSQISTRETYFERYQNVWDVMVTAKQMDVEELTQIGEIQKLPKVRSAIAYQKAKAKKEIGKDERSSEMKSFGGFSKASKKYVKKTQSGWLVNAPIIVLDDASFVDYCKQIGIEPKLDGAILRNQIRDVTNPDFRHPKYLPYVTTQKKTTVLQNVGDEKEMLELPVLAYTDKEPLLREEYASTDDYEMVHFLPASLWKKSKAQFGQKEDDTFICLRSVAGAKQSELAEIQEEIHNMLVGVCTVQSENRIQEKETNDRQIQGMLAVFGGFCILLAIIGLGNVFSNTLSYVRQRKREFARYMSVGVTPREMRKMFCVEAMVIAGRPILITIPCAIVVVGLLLKSSYMEFDVFMKEAPLLPILLFMFAMVGTVALAYCLSWRKVRKINLAEVLRDDTV